MPSFFCCFALSAAAILVASCSGGSANQQTVPTTPSIAPTCRRNASAVNEPAHPNCNADCDAMYCVCLGGAYAPGVADALAIHPRCAFDHGQPRSCAVAARCFRSRIACMHAHALDDAPTAVPTAVPTPPPPTEQVQCQAGRQRLKRSLLAIGAGASYTGSLTEAVCDSLWCTDFLGSLDACRNATAAYTAVACVAEPPRPSTHALTAQVRLAAVGLDSMLRRDEKQLRLFVQNDLAHALDVDFSVIDITSMTVGSLIVDFRVFADVTASVKALSSESFAMVAHAIGAPISELRVTKIEAVAVTPDIVDGGPISGATGGDTPSTSPQADDNDGKWSCETGCLAAVTFSGILIVAIVISAGVLVALKCGKTGSSHTGLSPKRTAHRVESEPTSEPRQTRREPAGLVPRGLDPHIV